MSWGPGGTGLGQRGVDGRGDLGRIGLLRQVDGQHLDLGPLLVGQILAAGLLELAERVLALLDQLVGEADDQGVVGDDALVDFTLLDGGHQHADRRQPIGLARLHGRLHVFVDPSLRVISGTPGTKKARERQRRGPWPMDRAVLSTSSWAASGCAGV
jgi:hypothetical protein